MAITYSAGESDLQKMARKMAEAEVPKDPFVGNKCISCGGERTYEYQNHFAHVEGCRLDTMAIIRDKGDEYVDPYGKLKFWNSAPIWECDRHGFVKLPYACCHLCWGEVRDEWVKFLIEDKVQELAGTGYVTSVDHTYSKGDSEITVRAIVAATKEVLNFKAPLDFKMTPGEPILLLDSPSFMYEHYYYDALKKQLAKPPIILKHEDLAIPPGEDIGGGSAPALKQLYAYMQNSGSMQKLKLSAQKALSKEEPEPDKDDPIPPF